MGRRFNVDHRGLEWRVAWELPEIVKTAAKLAKSICYPETHKQHWGQLQHVLGLTDRLMGSILKSHSLGSAYRLASLLSAVTRIPDTIISQSLAMGMPSSQFHIATKNARDLIAKSSALLIAYIDVAIPGMVIYIAPPITDEVGRDWDRSCRSLYHNCIEFIHIILRAFTMPHLAAYEIGEMPSCNGKARDGNTLNKWLGMAIAAMKLYNIAGGIAGNAVMNQATGFLDNELAAFRGGDSAPASLPAERWRAAVATDDQELFKSAVAEIRPHIIRYHIMRQLEPTAALLLFGDLEAVYNNIVILGATFSDLW